MIALQHIPTGRTLDIAPNSSINLVIENPLFQLALVGNYSTPFTLPITKNNVDFFNFFNAIHAKENKFLEEPFNLLIAEKKILEGKLKLINVSKNGFKVNFNSQTAVLKNSIQSRKLNEFISPSAQFGYKLYGLRNLLRDIFLDLGISTMNGSFIDFIDEYESYSNPTPNPQDFVSRDFVVWFYDEGLESTIENTLKNIMVFFNVAYIIRKDSVTIDFKKDAILRQNVDFTNKIESLLDIENDDAIHFYLKFAHNVVKARILNQSPAIVYPDGFFNFVDFGNLAGSDIIESDMLPVSIQYNYDGTLYDTVPALGWLTPSTFIDDYKKYSYMSVRTYRYLDDFNPLELTYLNKDPFNEFCFDFASNRSIPGANYLIGLYDKFWSVWDKFYKNKRPVNANIYYNIVDMMNDFYLMTPIHIDGNDYLQEKIQLKIENSPEPFKSPAKVKLQKIVR